MVQPLVDHAPARDLQHRLGDVDADDAGIGGVIGERDARADSNLLDTSADALACFYGHAARVLENGPENHIVDRRPAGICLDHCGAAEFGCHAASPSLRSGAYVPRQAPTTTQHRATCRRTFGGCEFPSSATHAEMEPRDPSTAPASASLPRAGRRERNALVTTQLT